MRKEFAAWFQAAAAHVHMLAFVSKAVIAHLGQDLPTDLDSLSFSSLECCHLNPNIIHMGRGSHMAGEAKVSSTHLGYVKTSQSPAIGYWSLTESPCLNIFLCPKSPSHGMQTLLSAPLLSSD